MSIRIAGFWDLEWNTPIKEIDKWQFLIREFDVEKLYLCPISGIANQFVTEKATIQEVFADCDGFTKVFVDEKATVELSNFTHPQNALYIFGKANYNPYLLKTNEDSELKINTPLNASGLLWADQVASIILYDRFNKGL